MWTRWRHPPLSSISMILNKTLGTWLGQVVGFGSLGRTNKEQTVTNQEKFRNIEL
jgi:hypothetical protein